ncbi:MAG: hypothetical protein JRF71_00855 [Deltaproteobacteria bacterium]|nr:hypothetical protein [Deltaproteobacteria bacterium]MBW2199375.1 hypothetical protein [Deltaproteobacteria bacterium]MBW2538156.1 hypothetical protein [Deltaproteobacteria bacterium]
MTKIVNFQAYRTRALEQRGFGPWYKRFGESYGEKTRLSDLSEKTLYLLSLPGETSAMAFYELIMGILDLGKASKFYYLDKEEQMQVVDIHLFLADQSRFEIMRRLGWLDRFASEKDSLLEMVQACEKVMAFCKHNPPELAESHPDYNAYKALTQLDRETFIRRMLPQALETFKKRIIFQPG